MASHRRYRSWLALGLVILVGVPARAQLQSIEQHSPEVAIPPPQHRAVEPPLTGAGPDSSGVWYFVHQHDLPRARAELDRLQDENPRWQPPADLLAAVNGTAPVSDPYGRNVTAAETTLKAGKVFRGLDALEKSIGEKRDSSAAQRLGWAFLDSGAPLPAQTWFKRASNWARPGSKQQAQAVSGLVKADAQLGQWTIASDQVAALPPGDARVAAAQILSDAAIAAATTAAKANDWQKADQLAAVSGAQGTTRVRTDLGWIALDANDRARAATLFEAGPQTEEARYGRILALSQIDGDIAPLKAACAPAGRSERAATACGDAVSARALKAYEAKDWAGVIALRATANDLEIKRSGLELLAGWSHYRRHEYDAALTAFDAAAPTEPDAVDGIVQTLMETGRYAELDRRAATAGPRFVAAYHRQLSDLALIRKRTTFASTLPAPGTEGIAEPSATIGFFARDKTGAAGADRVAWQGMSVSATTTFGHQRVSTGMDFGHVHIGTPQPGAPVGSILPSPTAPDHGATLAMPWVRWQDEGIDYAYGATFGTTPIGGAVDPLPAVALSAEHDWDAIIGTVSMRVAPRYDSLLAMAGQRDGATGEKWGRVVEIGPEAGVIVLLNTQWSLSVDAAVGSLQGHAVAGNTHVSTAISLTYEMKPTGFDYVRVGPLYSFDHYQRNENFFTLGNGGYYSPDQAHSVGAFADVLTPEGRTWQIGGRVTATWQHSVEDAAARFPLADDGSRFPRKVQTQFGTDSVIRASLLLSPHIILGAYGRVTYAPSGRDLAAGLSLTVPFGARSAVFSSDLPRFADRSWP